MNKRCTVSSLEFWSVCDCGTIEVVEETSNEYDRYVEEKIRLREREREYIYTMVNMAPTLIFLLGNSRERSNMCHRSICSLSLSSIILPFFAKLE